MRLGQERILLIGDADRQIHAALSQTLPSAQVTSVGGMFDAIAELAQPGGASKYSTVMAAAEPIERRPEAAVKVLRELAGDGRLLLFGHPTLEPLSRKMLDFGCDDYIVTPPSATELQQMFGAPPLRLTSAAAAPPETGAADQASPPLAASQPAQKLALLCGIPLAEILLDAMLHHPHDAPGAVVRQINTHIGPTMRLEHILPGKPAPEAPEGHVVLSHTLRAENADAGSIHLIIPRDEEDASARHLLAQLSHLLGKTTALRDRHNRMQKLAITDELTGLYNGRYFRHFLAKIIEKARTMYFPVTLFLFDLDDFKKYNDLFGHGVGDEILRQTAALMRRCVREHDLVARISGDEFAVVFWEKEGPRQPRDPNAPPAAPSRVPPSVQAMCDRFRRLISSSDFQLLGVTGKGTLTISGGLAVYPWNATTPEALIEAADHALMFEAKKIGKNTIFLVGDEPRNGSAPR
jgi:GGDEF domain-containing protein